MPPIDPEPNEEERQQKLEQDFDKPFSPPSGVQGGQPIDPSTTHPATDHRPDDQEVYDEGAEAASEIRQSEDEDLEKGEKIA